MFNLGRTQKPAFLVKIQIIFGGSELDSTSSITLVILSFWTNRFGQTVEILDQFAPLGVVCSGTLLWFGKLSFEPRREKTNILHMRKQRRRSASR